MRKDNLYIGKEAREKLMSGIKKVADAVGSTMGTGGSNSIIEAIESPGHLLTNDGITIAQSIHLSDPIEDMGRKILLESISRANKASGDGSSTTCVLTSAILKEGIKYLESHSPMDIKRSLEECVPFIEESIKKQTRDITVDEVGKVAAISAEDEAIGALIQEIYQQIGKDGIIHWDISKTPKDVYTIGQGITVEGAGFYSPYMCDADESGQNTNRIKLKNPKVLITKQKITSASEFNGIAESLFNKDFKDLVVFCDEVDPLVMADLIKTRMIRGFRIILVKMPVLWKDWWYEDLSKASGAVVIDPVAGLSLKSVTMEQLGSFENMLITKDDTFIDGMRDVSQHIKVLEDEGSDDSKLRASRLNTKTARLFIGAESDSALSYKRLKVEDAIAAGYHALQGGIVAGGGVALRDVAFQIDESVGGKILRESLQAPISQIMANVGLSNSGISPVVGFGVDTKTKEIVDMFDANIIDPANIVLNAVKNAVSVAASILTANTVVTLPREEEVQPQTPPVVI